MILIPALEKSAIQMFLLFTYVFVIQIPTVFDSILCKVFVTIEDWEMFKLTRMIKLKNFDGRMKVVKNDRLTSTERQNLRSFVVKIDRHCSATFRSTNSVFENKLSRVSNVPQANAVSLVGWKENRMGRFNNWTIFLLIINWCRNLSRQFNLLETANCLKPHSSER